MHPDDEARYSRRTVSALWNGGFEDRDEGRWIETPHWLDLRAYVERTGDLEAENVATVVDLERALTALQARHPAAAAVIACTALLDMDGHDLYRIFGGRTNWARIHNKAIAFMAGWLNGLPLDADDPDAPSCERLYRKAR